jgi:hypothetical protein
VVLSGIHLAANEYGKLNYDIAIATVLTAIGIM